jgi:hypothetical protein
MPMHVVEPAQKDNAVVGRPRPCVVLQAGAQALLEVATGHDGAVKPGHKFNLTCVQNSSFCFDHDVTDSKLQNNKHVMLLLANAVAV